MLKTVTKKAPSSTSYAAKRFKRYIIYISGNSAITCVLVDRLYFGRLSKYRMGAKLADLLAGWPSSYDWQCSHLPNLTTFTRRGVFSSLRFDFAWKFSSKWCFLQGALKKFEVSI